jgi:HTH-type transcriptional regulator / antitoxin HigA
MATLTKPNHARRDEYLELVRKFPLKPIRSDRHLREAHKVIDALTKVPEQELTRDQSDYLEVLGNLTDAYESPVMSRETSPVAGLDVLKHLMEANDMSASDLGRVLGQRELGSKVLRGDREISKAHAKSLGKHFGLPAETFLRQRTT